MDVKPSSPRPRLAQSDLRGAVNHRSRNESRRLTGSSALAQPVHARTPHVWWWRGVFPSAMTCHDTTPRHCPAPAVPGCGLFLFFWRTRASSRRAASAPVASRGPNHLAAQRQLNGLVAAGPRGAPPRECTRVTHLSCGGRGDEPSPQRQAEHGSQPSWGGFSEPTAAARVQAAFPTTDGRLKAPRAGECHYPLPTSQRLLNRAATPLLEVWTSGPRANATFRHS